MEITPKQREDRTIRRLVHLSDLHFGRIDQDLVDPLVRAVEAAEPDILAISGDFVQWAREHEFQQASEFVKRLPGHHILVPGNHDMPFLNPVRRVTDRLKLFRKYITDDREPFYIDDEIAVLGLNTARITHLRDGRIRSWQVERIEERFGSLYDDRVKVLVTHHPFDLPERYNHEELIGRRVLPRVVKEVDLLLAGHMHISYAGRTATRYKIEGHSAIFVQAGTALSTRVRGEANSFNVIEIHQGHVRVQQFTWSDEARGYACFADSSFEWQPGRGWIVAEKKVESKVVELA
jgi:3',5'-cyclic AMP phosphodiesterase CpdA